MLMSLLGWLTTFAIAKKSKIDTKFKMCEVINASSGLIYTSLESMCQIYSSNCKYIITTPTAFPIYVCV